MDRHKAVAKWGAACAACSAAKARCHRSAENPGAKCDRCERLFKDCVNQTHKPRKKRATKPSRTAQLEQRLNGLVDLLRSSGELRGVDPGSLAAQDVRATVEKTSCIQQETDFDISVAGAQSVSSLRDGSSDEEEDDEEEEILPVETVISVPRHYNSYAPSSCICRAESGDAPGPSETDETILAVYQTHLSSLFPFVIIPPGTTPEELQSSRPFLFAAIRMVTTLTSMRSMRAQLFRLMEHLSDYVMMRGQKSLDILQGIIVMGGWYHYHCIMHSQMNTLILLAQSLVADLGLNRHPQLQERTSLMVLFPDEPAPRSNEERRALLGVWYLSSCASVGFGKIESMKFSSYMQHCLKELQENREYETDVILAHMVRLQNLSEKIAELNARDESSEEISIPRAPVSAYVSTFQSELDKIQSSISKTMKNNKYLMVYVHSVSLRLYEPPVIDAALLRQFHNDLTSLSDNTPSALDVFYRASHAIQTWLNHWFTIPISSYFYLPMPVCAQLIYSVTMLSRWAKLVSPVLPGSISSKTKIIDPSAEARYPRSVNILAALREQVQGDLKGCVALGPPPSFDEPGHGQQQQQQQQQQRRATSSSTSPPASTGGRSTTPASTPSTQPELLVKLMAGVKFRETKDPSIPHLVAAMKDKLNSQPGLRIDITGMLNQLGTRCAQASQEMMEVGGGEEERNVWDLAAKKIIITVAKLERWAEIVAQGAQGRKSPQGNSGVEGNEGNSGVHPTQQQMQEPHSQIHQEALHSRNQQIIQDIYGVITGGTGAYGATNPDQIGIGSLGVVGQMPVDCVPDTAHEELMGNNCGEYWLSGPFDNLDPSTWGTEMDWGPVNLF